MRYSLYAIAILLVIFLIFLAKAYIEDQQYYNHHIDGAKCPVCNNISIMDCANDPQKFHKAVVDTMNYEQRYGRFADSKVKKILISTRDQVFRGILMGALEGNAVSALHGAVAWSLIGGIISCTGDLFSWQTKFM